MILRARDTRAYSKAGQLPSASRSGTYLVHRSKNRLKHAVGRTALIFPLGARLRPSPVLCAGAHNPHRASFGPGHLRLTVWQRLRIGHRSAIHLLLQGRLFVQVDYDDAAQAGWADAPLQLSPTALPQLDARLLLRSRQRRVDMSFFDGE